MSTRIGPAPSIWFVDSATISVTLLKPNDS